MRSAPLAPRLRLVGSDPADAADRARRTDVWRTAGGTVLAIFVASIFLDLNTILPDDAATAGKYLLRLLFGLFTVAALIARRDAIVPVLRVQPLFAVLLAWFAVTIALGLNPALGTVRLVFFVYTAATALALALTVGSPADALRWVYRGCLPLVVANAAIFVVDPSFGGDVRDGFAGLSGDKNGAGQFFVVALIVSVHVVRAVPAGVERAGAIATALISLFLLTTTDSKTSIAMGITGTLLCGLRYGVLSAVPRAGGVLLLAAAAGLAAAVVAGAVAEITPAWVARQFEDVTFTNRREIWELVALAILSRPATGYGFGSFWQADPLQNPFGRMTHLDVFQTWVNEASRINQAHNGYLDLVLNTGAVGLVLALATVWLVLRRLVGLMRAIPAGSPDRSALLAAHSLVVWVLLNNTMESTIFYAPIYSLGTVLVLVLVLTDVWWAANAALRRSAGRDRA